MRPSMSRRVAINALLFAMNLKDDDKKKEARRVAADAFEIDGDIPSANYCRGKDLITSERDWEIAVRSVAANVLRYGCKKCGDIFDTWDHECSERYKL